MDNELKNILSFKDLIENGFFKIPNYQRYYSWDEEQLQRFMLDLDEYNQEYYLGHFLFESKQENRFNIIDGQQRLTTILLFLRSLYEINNDLVNKKTYFNEIEPKLIAVEADRDVFSKLTTENGLNVFNKETLATLSQEKMIKAKDYFITELSKRNDINQLSSYIKTIETARISCSIFDSKIIANQVFMFHNNRGKSLRNLDLLKSFLINLLNKCDLESNKLKETIETVIDTPFGSIIKYISKISKYTFHPNEDQILNYHWVVYYGKTFKYNDFEKEYKDKYKLDPNDKEAVLQIRDFINNIKKSYEHILSIVNEAESNYKIANVLALSSGYQEYSLLLALSLNDNNWNNEFNNQVLKLMEITLFKNDYASTNTRSNYFDWLAHHFFTNSKHPWLADKEDGRKEVSLMNRLTHYAKNGFHEYWKTGENFVKCFDYRENKINDFYNKSTTKYLLWKYENYLRKKEANTTNPSFINANEYLKNKDKSGNFVSIEHVYPQNPKLPYISLGDVVHDIGNLIAMPLPLNIGLSNKDPKTKYADHLYPSEFRHHNKVMDKIGDNTWNNAWDKKAIRENGKQIKDFALQYFSIYKPILSEKNEVEFIENDNKIDIKVDASVHNIKSY